MATADSARNLPRIFVSHSHHDDEVGLRLAADLQARLGKDAVWYDAFGGLRVGDEWWHKIVGEITARDTFIVILSPNAVASDWVRREMAMAYVQHVRQGKRLLPLAYQPCELSADWELIQSLPISDPAVDPDAYSSQLARVFDALGIASITMTPNNEVREVSHTRQVVVGRKRTENLHQLARDGEQVRISGRERMRLGPINSIILGIRILICWAILVLYWLVIGYTTPAIFPEKILRISGSEYMTISLRGNSKRIDLLKALIVFVSLTTDWFLAGMILSRIPGLSFFSLPYAVVSNVIAAISLGVFFILFLLYLVLTATGWRYTTVINLRKILEVMLVTTLLFFASQLKPFGAAFLYFPVIASVVSMSLFLYGVISVGSTPGSWSNGRNLVLDKRIQAQHRDNERKETFFKGRMRKGPKRRY